MRAQAGDRIDLPAVPDHRHRRRGLLVGVAHADGTPPYRVHGLDDDRESLLVPPPRRDLAQTRPPRHKKDEGPLQGRSSDAGAPRRGD